ncbi:MAG: (Fe-S)-binding protein [Bacteroidetes bacterium]|nr:MAG: (Fe-S)-binding protein [Bacteroidota bacterium]MBL1144719.1 (Fe-S)-binding protein [Bacteroidota bacterium]MCB0803516.1 (Fe-S)-binding protein [Flavobacteriales bacterium]NOG57513.1 (Fe-S)-binding protein [Bacteroidota bacterium]
MGISNIFFIIALAAAGFWFAKNLNKIIRNINLGKDIDRGDSKAERWKKMFMVAIGQSKMVKKPISGALHIAVYVGFVIINIEMLEIVIDGIFGTHRVLAEPLGSFYNILIGSFEILAFLVLISCLIFLIRRNVLKVKRFGFREMLGWPKTDANIILIVEIMLMSAFLKMNAADYVLQQRGVEHYIQAGAFPISGSLIVPLYESFSTGFLIFVERVSWWFHIIGVLLFLNYLPYSKHFHIILAFPNVFFSKLDPKGKFTNMEAVTKEVKLMFDPEADPYAAPAEPEGPVERFGAKDVQDLTWKQLMDAYSCTECGRCTEQCPAAQTGKLLSPRKIMMDTRDRLEEVGKNIAKHGADHSDGKSLLGDYILEEELWACTTCNACTEACPVMIDPLSIIMDMRRSLIMEDSKAPAEITNMLNNIENNGAPWQFSQTDRANWVNEG